MLTAGRSLSCPADRQTSHVLVGLLRWITTPHHYHYRRKRPDTVGPRCLATPLCLTNPYSVARPRLYSPIATPCLLLSGFLNRVGNITPHQPVCQELFRRDSYRAIWRI